MATGGVFDPLHRGHAESLAAARALGDCLLVLVNSDASAAAAHRRGGALADRVAALAPLEGVDGVVPFEADDPRAVLDALRPDLWVKGGDHDPADLPETPLVRSWGGEVVAVPYRPTPDGAVPRCCRGRDRPRARRPRACWRPAVALVSAAAPVTSRRDAVVALPRHCALRSQ